LNLFKRRLYWLLILAFPLLELFLLIKLGGLIGAFNTLALVVLSAIVGLVLVRYQGLTTAMRARQRMLQGEPPQTEALEGLLLVIAGILLVIPGLITDALGALCLIPPVRRYVAYRLLTKAWGYGAQYQRRRRTVIEGEYQRENNRSNNNLRQRD
jgi:UPF0716 protein FxsA